MSDLTGKFGSFQEQSATQHSDLMAALSTIAYALGAPPTVPGVTLADIATKLDAIIDGMALQYDANTTYQSDVLSVLGQINTSADIIINNNSLNTQKLIAALYATFCDCEITTPLLAPPIDVTPTSLVDEAKCRRIQFYLSVFGNWLNAIANYGNAGAAITGGTLAYLLSVVAADAGIVATGAEVGAVGGIPGVVAGAVVGLLIVAVYTLGGSVLVDYANQFNDPTLRDNMVQAMYDASNADEGYIAFKSTLLASMDAIAAEPIYTLWWSAWSNDIYSGSPVVDDSAFDGSICAPEVVVDCILVVSGASIYGHTTTDWAGSTPPQPLAGSGDLSYATPTEPLAGWVITEIVAAGTLNVWVNGGSHGGVGVGWTVPDSVGTSMEFYLPENTPWTMTLCPPEL